MIGSKGVYYPTMRQRPTRDNQLLLGLSTIQQSGGQYYDNLHRGVTGVGYSNPGGSTITKPQPGKVSIPSQSMNFPSFDDDGTGNKNSQQPSSLI